MDVPVSALYKLVDIVAEVTGHERPNEDTANAAADLLAGDLVKAGHEIVPG